VKTYATRSQTTNAAPSRVRRGVPAGAHCRIVAMLSAGTLLMGMSAHAGTTEPSSQMDEVDVTSDKQTALDAEAISLSDTPDAEPSTTGKTTYVIGLAARAAPVYEGSKTIKVSPFPYVDVHGLWNDRLFVSDIRGLGINLVNLGPLRAGAAVNYGGGRTSSDATRLRGLRDISGALSASGFMTYSFKPFALEAEVERQFGSQPAIAASLRGSYAVTLTPRWHFSAGAQVVWHERKYNEKYFGITPSESAQATAKGNTLTPYSPGSGVGRVGVTATSVYALTEHWGIVSRLGLRDVIGSADKDSPLTGRQAGVDFAAGVLYKF
jgi:MipA family protein